MIASVSLYFFFTAQRIIFRIPYIFIFLVSVFNVMGTGSRGAFIAMLLALFIFWALSEIAHKSAIMMTTFLAAATLVIVMVILIPNLDVTRSFTFEKESTDTAEMRWENIPVAIKMFGDHPIIGNGPDGFVINYTRYASGLTKYASREKTLKTHNTPLQILAEYGLVGITLFGLIIFMSLKRMVAVMRKAEDKKDRMIAVALIAAISAYIFFMATSNTLLDKYFWLLITLAQIHYSICLKNLNEQAPAFGTEVKAAV
jgi:O-antigen ligase